MRCGTHLGGFALLAVLGSMGCASGPSGSGGTEEAVRVVADGAAPVDLRRGVEGTLTVVQHGQVLGGLASGSVTQAWTALQAAYDTLGLPLSVRVPSEGRVGSTGYRLVRLAGRRASTYVDCGSNLSGRIADDAEVLLNVHSAVEAAAGGQVLLGTRVDAEARARGNLEGIRDCTSTGRLETLILQHVRQALAR